MDDPTRRGFLVSSAAAGGLFAVSGWILPSVADAAPRCASNGLSRAHFRVALAGKTLPGVVAFRPGRLALQVKPNPQKAGNRRWVHGDHEYQDAVLTVRQGAGATRLQKWADKAMKAGGTGDALRRDVSLFLLGRDKSTVLRTVNLFGCYPTDFDAGDQGAGQSEIKTITLSFNVDRIEVT